MANSTNKNVREDWMCRGQTTVHNARKRERHTHFDSSIHIKTRSACSSHKETEQRERETNMQEKSNLFINVG